MMAGAGCPVTTENRLSSSQYVCAWQGGYDMVALTLYSASNFLSLSWCICSTYSGNWDIGMALRPVTGGRGSDWAIFQFLKVLQDWLSPILILEGSSK